MQDGWARGAYEFTIGKIGSEVELAGAGGGMAKDGELDFISADPRSNSIVVRASDKKVREITDVLKRLDIEK